MKIFLICSKRFYERIPDIERALKEAGHVLTLPNCYEDPTEEARYRAAGREAHATWKAGMFRESERIIEKNDAVLVLNFEKDGMKNYIGGATFLEMYDAFRLKKKIYILNEIPEGMLRDEINGFEPIILGGDLSLIK